MSPNHLERPAHLIIVGRWKAEKCRCQTSTVSRAKAEECRTLAARIESEIDQNSWLRLAAEWDKLAENAAQRRGIFKRFE